MTKSKEKYFKRADIIVYAILTVIAACLFFVSVKPTINSDCAFTVQVKGEVVFKGDFQTKTYTVTRAESVKKLSDDVFEIITEKGKNVIKIDWENSDVTVVETDCGTTKECTYMSLKNGDIICVPHSLVIKLTGSVPDPVVG